MITPDEATYLFPLGRGVIENVFINSKKVSLNINGKSMTKEQALNQPLKLNNAISFKLNDIRHDINNCLFAEIIVKCPVKFENNSVISERAFDDD
jgi:hypothetical protein